MKLSFFHAFSLLLCTAFVLAGCGTKEPPRYSPHSNLLSLAAEFQLLAPQDPYREAPGKDLTGQSIARVTLVRLSNYQSLHPARFTPEVLMIQGRALELMGDLETAQANYRECATYGNELEEEAARRTELLERLLAVRAIAPAAAGLEETLDALRRQGREYHALADTLGDPYYRALALREMETAEVRRAELLAANRHLFPNGEEEAQLALEALVRNHRDSRRASEHVLALARFHRTNAEEEVRLYPPEMAGFASERFRRHYDAAAELLYRLSQADGRPERNIARHELDALLALGEYVSQRVR